MSKNEWDYRVARAQELANKFPFAAEILNFYGRVAVFQKAVYEQAARQCALATGHPGLRGQLDIELALQHLPTLFSLVEQHGPPGLAGAARRLREEDRHRWSDLLAEHVRGDGPSGEPAHFFARVCLQPVAEYIAGNSDRMQLTSHTGALCPLCNSRPQAAVLRPEGDGAKRSLICSFCLAEWNFRRVVCPACGEEDKDKLPRYSAEDFPHVRVEACDACKMYLKSVDLSVNGRAVPVVDEIAAAPLDLWAADQGYRKIELNLVNC
jgi:FdhE protein